jgi:hypothetical protein
LLCDYREGEQWAAPECQSGESGKVEVVGYKALGSRRGHEQVRRHSFSNLTFI